MNPFQKVMSWWRGPTDPESVVAEAEAQRLQADNATIRTSQNNPPTARGGANPILVTPTPDVLDPARGDSTESR